MGAGKKTPAQRAAACLAIERSSAHEGERAVARERRLAICRRHGLNSEALDVATASSTVPRGLSCWEAALASAAVAMREAELWEAGRRVLMEETRLAAERDRAHRVRRRAEATAADLAEQGLHPLRDGPDHWLIPGADGLERLDHAGLVEFGQPRLQVAA